MSFLPVKNNFPLKIKQYHDNVVEFFDWNDLIIPLYRYEKKFYHLYYFRNKGYNHVIITIGDMNLNELKQEILKHQYIINNYV